MNNKIIKYRWWIIALSVIITLGFSTLLSKLEIDPELKNYFPKSMTSMVNTDRIEEVFGNQDLVMIIFETDDVLSEETLKRVKKVEKEFGRIEGVRTDLIPVWIKPYIRRRRGYVCGAHRSSHTRQ